MASFNRVIIVGNLTKDPDLKQIGSGQSVCRLSIASNRQFKHKQNGTMVQEVCYVDVDVWGAQAENARQYLQKGKPVLIEGRLKFDMWKDSDGQTRSKHSIVADRVIFLGSNQAAELASAEGLMQEDKTAAPAAAKNRAKSSKPAASEEPAMFIDEPPFEEDLPF